MKLLLKKFVLLSTAIFLTSTVFSGDVQAQRKSGSASLAELGCQKFGGRTDYGYGFSIGGYIPTNQDVIIGSEVLRAFAYLGNNDGVGYSGIYPSDGSEKVACRLAPVNSSSDFRSLILQFGLNEGSRLIDGSVSVRLRVILDGEYYGEKLITRGDLIRWSIPVSGKRSIALEGSCIHRKIGEDACPNIVFVQDLLTR